MSSKSPDCTSSDEGAEADPSLDDLRDAFQMSPRKSAESHSAFSFPGLSFNSPQKEPRSSQSRHVLNSDIGNLDVEQTMDINTKKQTSVAETSHSTSDAGNQPLNSIAISSPSSDRASTFAESQKRFLLAHKDKFLAVLPESNVLSKMIDENPFLAEIATTRKEPHSPITQPSGVTNVKMKPYQLDGLAFLKRLHANGMPAILADEMGLGKTLQTLALLQSLREENRSLPNPISHRFLVVAPLSVVQNWIVETGRFVPDLRVFRLHGHVKSRTAARKQLLKIAHNTDGAASDLLVVTSYESFQAEARFLNSRMKWTYIILDEAHRIKNPNAHATKQLNKLHCQSRLALTGTPLQNNLLELWSLLHWLLPSIFGKGTDSLFEEAFDLSKGKADVPFIDGVKDLLKVIMIRRTKDEVDLRLPAKKEVSLLLPLTELQRKVYQRIITHADLEGTGPYTGTGAKSFRQKLMNLLMELRMVCIHPYTIRGIQPDPYMLGTHVFESSAKFVVLHRLLLQVLEDTNRKLIVFSGFTTSLDLCEDLLGVLRGSHDFKYVRMDGSSSRARRQLVVRKFQDPSLGVKVFLATTRAAGQGLNLTAASDVVFLDDDWNPQMTLQAEARAHRIGQTRSVTVWKLLTHGTVEDQMQGRLKKKRFLAAKIDEPFEADDANPSQQDVTNSLSTRQLKGILLKGTATLSGPAISPEDLESWNLDEIVNKCSATSMATAEISSPDEEIDEETWLQGVEKIRCREFEGRDHPKRTAQSEESPIIETPRAARRIGKETTVHIGGHIVSKWSLTCEDGAAVPTLFGSDPSLAEPKRAKRKPFGHQTFCLVCKEPGSDLTECVGCPRSFHQECIPERLCAKVVGGIRCSHHQCFACNAKLSEAGGLLYCCSDCFTAFCTDCLPSDHELLDDERPEFVELGFGANEGMTFIKCPECLGVKIDLPADPADEIAEPSTSIGDDVMADKDDTEEHIVLNEARLSKVDLSVENPFKTPAMEDDDVIFVEMKSKYSDIPEVDLTNENGSDWRIVHGKAPKPPFERPKTPEQGLFTKQGSPSTTGTLKRKFEQLGTDVFEWS